MRIVQLIISLLDLLIKTFFGSLFHLSITPYSFLILQKCYIAYSRIVLQKNRLQHRSETNFAKLYGGV